MICNWSLLVSILTRVPRRGLLGSMVGRARTARKNEIIKNAPPHSWIRNPGFKWMKCYVKSSPCVPPVYLLCGPMGHITVHEEYLAWLWAVDGKARPNRRRVYNRSDPGGSISEKVRLRAADLWLEHNSGKIDLYKGPWSYYGFDVGTKHDPGTVDIADYGVLCRKAKCTNQMT